MPVSEDNNDLVTLESFQMKQLGAIKKIIQSKDLYFY